MVMAFIELYKNGLYLDSNLNKSSIPDPFNFKLLLEKPVKSYKITNSENLYLCLGSMSSIYKNLCLLKEEELALIFYMKNLKLCTLIDGKEYSLTVFQDKIFLGPPCLMYQETLIIYDPIYLLRNKFLTDNFFIKWLCLTI